MPDFLQILHDGSCSDKQDKMENAEKPKTASRQQVPDFSEDAVFAQLPQGGNIRRLFQFHQFRTVLVILEQSFRPVPGFWIAAVHVRRTIVDSIDPAVETEG